MAATEKYDTYIDSNHGRQRLNLGELRHSWDLIYLMTTRDLISQYKQSILGPLWILIAPLLTSVMFSLVFGRLAGLSTDNLPRILFYLTGNTMWSLFSSCVTRSSSAFVTNRVLFSKVYFPRLSICVSNTLSSLITFIVQFAMLVLFIVYYLITGVDLHITLYALLAPVLLLQCLILGTGIGMILSSITIKYRDVMQLIGFTMTVWMYLTPVAYPLSITSGKLYIVMLLNPMTSVVQNYRFALLGSGSFLLWPWIGSLLFSVAAFFFGIWCFRRVENTVVDTL